MLLKYEEELWFFVNIKRVPGYIYAKDELVNTNYVRKDNGFSYHVVSAV